MYKLRFGRGKQDLLLSEVFFIGHNILCVKVSPLHAHLKIKQWENARFSLSLFSNGLFIVRESKLLRSFKIHKGGDAFKNWGF